MDALSCHAAPSSLLSHAPLSVAPLSFVSLRSMLHSLCCCRMLFYHLLLYAPCCTLSVALLLHAHSLSLSLALLCSCSRCILSRCRTVHSLLQSHDPRRCTLHSSARSTLSLSRPSTLHSISHCHAPISFLTHSFFLLLVGPRELRKVAKEYLFFEKVVIGLRSSEVAVQFRSCDALATLLERLGLMFESFRASYISLTMRLQM